MMMLKQPPACGEVSIRFPKGQSAKKLSFNVWMPKGIPMMVTIIAKLETIYSTAVTIPPRSNQRIFIKMLMTQIPLETDTETCVELFSCRIVGCLGKEGGAI